MIADLTQDLYCRLLEVSQFSLIQVIMELDFDITFVFDLNPCALVLAFITRLCAALKIEQLVIQACQTRQDRL